MKSFLILLCLLPWLRCSADSYSGKGLTVELVSEVTTVRPGQPFYAGLSIKHEAGYHTYWLNPGLAGVATKMEWTLPKDWTAGDIEWPAPDKVKMAQINTHGFERDVLLMVKITPPAMFSAGEVTLKTKASWMCCGTQCNPGFCDLTLTLPVNAGEGAALSKEWHAKFERERTQMPVPAAGWKFSARRDGRKIILTGESAAALPEKPVFFSTDNLICSHPPQVWRKTEKGFEAELTLSDFPPKDPSKLRGLLRGQTGWNAGDTRAVTFQAPIR